MVDYKKLAQEKSELKEAWDYLSIEADFPDKDIRIWLLDFSKDEIESAFHVLTKKGDKVEDPVKYLGRVLHNAKQQNMTPEDREQQISLMRSAIGKLGAAKSHAKQVAYIKDEFAQVCSDLPKACQTLLEVSRNLPLDTDSGFGVGSGSVSLSVSGSGRGSGTEAEAAAPPVASTPSQREEKATPKPETNPVPMSGVSPNRKTKTKPKTIKTAVGNRPKPEDFDSWSNADRVEWMNCTCGADMRQDSDGYRYLVHSGTCSVDNMGQIKGQAKAAAAPNGDSLDDIVPVGKGFISEPL